MHRHRSSTCTQSHFGFSRKQTAERPSGKGNAGGGEAPLSGGKAPFSFVNERWRTPFNFVKEASKWAQHSCRREGGSGGSRIKPIVINKGTQHSCKPEGGSSGSRIKPIVIGSWIKPIVSGSRIKPIVVGSWIKSIVIIEGKQEGRRRYTTTATTPRRSPKAASQGLGGAIGSARYTSFQSHAAHFQGCSWLGPQSQKETYSVLLEILPLRNRCDLREQMLGGVR